MFVFFSNIVENKFITRSVIQSFYQSKALLHNTSIQVYRWSVWVLTSCSNAFETLCYTGRLDDRRDTCETGNTISAQCDCCLDAVCVDSYQGGFCKDFFKLCIVCAFLFVPFIKIYLLSCSQKKTFFHQIIFVIWKV